MPATWLETREIALSELTRFPGNARRGDVKQIARSLYRNGQYRSLVIRQHDGHLTILAGNHTRDALELLYGGWLPPGISPPGRWAGQPQVARCELIECDDDEALRINLADNKTGEFPDPETGERYDDLALAELLASLDGDLEGSGWDVYDLDGLADALGRDEPNGSAGGPGDGPGAGPEVRPSLADRFLISPFDVLDARQGWWQQRKKAWIGLGIRSEVGRSGRLTLDSEHVADRDYYRRRNGEKPSGARGGGLTFKGQESLNRIMHE